MQKKRGSPWAGKVLVFASAKGGAGKTTLAVAVAGELAAGRRAAPRGRRGGRRSGAAAGAVWCGGGVRCRGQSHPNHSGPA
jgi:hypothetical protein